jgi:hypothetical protein
MLRERGPTAQAFSFRHAFAPADMQVAAVASMVAE